MAVYSSASLSSVDQIASARHVRCQYDPSEQQQLGQSSLLLLASLYRMPVVADYISLVQHALHQVSPSALDHRRYRDYTNKRAISIDRTASGACSMLLSSALLYNISVLWRLMHVDAVELAGRPLDMLVASATTGVCWVLAHVLMELAFMCWVSREPALYKRHRSACIMVTRTGLLLLMSLYIPRTYEHTLVIEVHAGREAAATLRIVTGFVAIHVIEVLCFRLPTKLAVPYHCVRVVIAFVAVPETLRSFSRHPSVTAVACTLWNQIGQLYLAAATWVLGAPLVGAEAVLEPDAAAATGDAGLCTALVLLVFLSLAIGLMIPLYVLYMWEVSDLWAFMAAGERGSLSNSSTSNSSNGGPSMSSGSMNTTSSGSVTSRVLSELQQRLGTSSFSHTTAAGDVRQAATAAGSDSGVFGSSQRPSAVVASSSAGGGDRSLPSAMAPAAARRFEHHPPSTAGAPGSSIDSSHVSYANVWPSHFGAPFHAIVLFCCTGVLWAVLNSFWGLWQRRFGEDACFLNL